MLLVIGNYNTHLGQSDVQYTYHQNTNKNGQLLNLANECTTNTKFKREKENFGRISLICQEGNHKLIIY